MLQINSVSISKYVLTNLYPRYVKLLFFVLTAIKIEKQSVNAEWEGFMEVSKQTARHDNKNRIIEIRAMAEDVKNSILYVKMVYSKHPRSLLLSCPVPLFLQIFRRPWTLVIYVH